MFKMSTCGGTLFLAGMVGLACSSSGLKSRAGDGVASGGQAGSTISSGTSGGTGGAIGTGGAWGVGSGGAGNGAAGTIGAGGFGGARTAGASGNTGGTGGCSRIDCHMPACAGEFQPNPDPCGCAVICVLTPDAGAAKDAGGPDFPAYCELVDCPIERPCSSGYARSTDPCGCPICAPVDSGTTVDGGKPDGPPPCRIACPMLVDCVGGYLPNPDPCTCPVCAANPDAGTTCADAKTRVAALCPTLSGPTFDGVCTWPATECVTQCLAQVSSCSDVGCAFCENCDCAGGPFDTCYQQCAGTFGH